MGLGKTLQVVLGMLVMLEQLLKTGTDYRAHMDAIKYVRCLGRNLLFNLASAEQNPYSGKGPIIGRALIVCPVSLINVGWKNLSPCSSFIQNIQRFSSLCRTGKPSSTNG